MTSIPKSIDIGQLSYGTKYFDASAFNMHGERNEIMAFLLEKDVCFKFSLLPAYHYTFKSVSFISSPGKSIQATLYYLDGKNLLEVAYDSSQGAYNEFEINYDCPVKGVYFLSLQFKGTSQLSIQIKCRPIDERLKIARTLQASPPAPNNAADKILRPDFSNGDSPSREALEDSLPVQNRQIIPGAPQEIVHLQEFYSAHIGFEVEFFSALEQKPAENFMRELQGSGHNKVVIHTEPLKPHAQALDWKSDDWTVSIARAGAGVSILGLSYGNKNTILALVQNASGVYKLYKISGFAKSPRLIVKAKGLDVTDEEVKAYGADRRNPLIEGRRRTGDRRLGSDRRREPALGRRSGKDRRKRSMEDRRNRW